jgi:AhpD family alkylhydroperoxidase
MTHVTPLRPDQVPALAAVFERARAAMGFVPNSMLTMAHMPQLPAAFSLLAGVVFGADLQKIIPAAAIELPPAGDSSQNLPPDLVQLVAYTASLTAGCRYCQAHTSHNAHNLGTATEKLAAIPSYETSDAFSASERAALALAFAAAAVPNETTDSHFTRLREHFSERQIVQLVAVIALFGFLNRWNDTMATPLEDDPAHFGETHLAKQGWTIGKHARELP